MRSSELPDIPRRDAASDPYHSGMRRRLSTDYPPVASSTLPMDETLLKPGLRLAVGVSGGADSVAMLRALSERSGPLGLVLRAAHLHHGLRGAEADADLAFVRELAAKLGIPFHEARVDTTAEAKAQSETIEEAARRLRYRWFRQLMATGEVEAVATAHTRDDQAETVLAKFLRGAWTEGLSGIYPVVEFPEGRILRPFLATTRAEVEAYLKRLGQSWREDSSNRHLTFTRNRIRHELLPLLEGWNPQLREHLSQMAALAPALLRRLMRYAAGQLGATLDFASTEVLRALALTGHAGQKSELAQGLRAERTQRELRLTVGPVAKTAQGTAAVVPEYCGTIPGEIVAPAFGLRLRIEVSSPAQAANGQASISGHSARLRNWRPGDQVKLRYSSGPRKVKEVLERLRITGSRRAVWPVLEVEGRLVWMQGAELDLEPGLDIAAHSLDNTGDGVSV